MANTTADKIFVGELGKSTKKIYDALDKVGVQTLKDVQKVGKHNAGSALLGMSLSTA